MELKQKTPIVFFNSPFSIPAINSFRDYLKTQSDRFELLITSDSKVAYSFLNDRHHGLVIFELATKEQVLPVTELTMNLAAPIKTGQVKVIGSVTFDAKKLAIFLMKKGCTEILNANLNARSLQHKVDRLIQIIQSQHQRNGGGNAKAVFNPSKKINDINTGSGASRSQLEIEWVPPLNLDSDCWLIKKRSDIKHRRQKWIYELLGPPPSFGRWEKIKNQPAGISDGDTCWSFNPRASRLPFYKNDGVWVFTGRIPEFNWQTLSWTFIGTSAILEFWDGSTTLGGRFLRMGPALIISQNQKNSQILLQEIENLLSANLSEELNKKDLPESKKRELEAKKNTLRSALELSKETSAGGFTGKSQLETEEPFEDAENPEIWFERLPDLQMELIAELEYSFLKVKLIDLCENELTIQADEELDPLPPKIEVYFSVKGGATPVEFSAKGGVTEGRKTEHGKTNILIDLQEFDNVQLDKFTAIFAKRQIAARDFINTVKGLI
jgi:hypothetical protein